MVAKCLVLENGCSLTLYTIADFSDFLRMIDTKQLKSNQGLLFHGMELNTYVRHLGFDMIFTDDEGYIIGMLINGKIESKDNLSACQNTVILECGMIGRLGLHCGDYILI